jgi:hypothetical protein
MSLGIGLHKWAEALSLGISFHKNKVIFLLRFKKKKVYT